MSVTPDAEPPKPPELEPFDAALSPIRRVLRYAVLPGSSARFVGVIAGRWVQAARDVGAPDVVSELLDELAEAFDGLDGLELAEQRARREVAFAALSRIDALLGLPLPQRRAKRSPGQRGNAKGRQRNDKKSTGPRREAAPRSKTSPPKSTDARPAATPPPSVRWSDPQLAARPLSALEADDAVLEALLAQGISTVGQLLSRRPTGEEVVQPVLGAGRITDAGRIAVGGRVRVRTTRLTPAGGRTTEVVIQGAGPTTLRWVGGAPGWLVETLAPGTRAVVVGMAEVVPDQPQVVLDPELATDDGKHAARLSHHGLDGVEDRAVRALVRQALPPFEKMLDPLGLSLPAERGLPPLATSLIRAHTLGSRGKQAAARLAYDEGLLVHMALLWPRFAGSRERGVPHTLVHSLVSKAVQRIEVELSDEQQLAFEDVKRDLRAPVPMRRVLTGEVGAGKGLVSLLSTVLVAENKHQVMVLAPDQATAEQRYAFTEPVLRDLGLVARLYTSEPSESQRDAIRRGEVHVLFGSTELLDAGLEFRRLGLVMAGERDVYGAVAKQVAAMRPPLPDLLVITSTPVPQPVLMAAFPSFDVTMLRSLPGKPVPCAVVPSSERSDAYAKAAESVQAGRQVVVVFPMHRGADVLDVREALRVVSTLETRVFEGARVKLFHGAMSREERYRTYTDFRDHRVDVLVATTHFEAGPSVPNANTVIVEQADRMRLSRLHRVRGHIAAGRHDPRCVLITGEHPDEAGISRVERFAKSREGFSVSVQELDDRGLADMVVEGTPPEPRFSWLDSRKDLDTLVLTRADARRILESDPGLRRPANVELARYLKARWTDLVGTESPVQVSGGGSSSRRRRRRRKR